MGAAVASSSPARAATMGGKGVVAARAAARAQGSAASEGGD